jgi:hypothetical protein
MTARHKSAAVEPIADDILWGAELISAEIGLPLKKTLYHLSRGNLPAKKCGALWTASRRALRTHLLGAAEPPAAA